MNTTTETIVVKNFPLIDTKQNDIILQFSENLSQKLEDNLFSRWYLRTHFNELFATPAGEIWFKKFDPTDIGTIKGLKSTLRIYQKLALTRMLISNCALWLDMGLGKTLICIAYSLLKLEENQSKTFLIIAPPSVFVTWIDEIEKHIDRSLVNYEVFIAHGTKKQDALAALRTSKAPVKFVITSYETLANVFEPICAANLTSIFIDESSKVKNIDTARTKSVFRTRYAKHNASCFCLSGTPSTKSPLGLYSQYELLNQGASGHASFKAFENEYAIKKLFMMVRLPNGKVTGINVDDDPHGERWLASNTPPKSSITYLNLNYKFSKNPQGPKDIKIMNYHYRLQKFKNLEKLHAVTQKNAYTLHKSDVLTDLPEKTRVTRSITLSPEQRKAYTEITETCRTIIANTPFSFSAMASPFCKLHQIANGYLLDQNGDSIFFKSQPKLDEIVQILEETGDEKLVVWAPFRALIERVCQHLEANGETFCEIHGGVDIKARQSIVRAFQDPAGPRVLVANPSVAGMGLNLTSAWTEVFVTNWFSPDVRIQAEDRLHRIGQKNAVTVIDLIAASTLEAKILRDTLNEISLERQILSMADILGA